MVWQAGQSLYGNRYTIQKAIGKGGFGITYLAHDGKGRAWVIKTLKDEVMTQEEYAEYRNKYLRDFKNEALWLAICRHPHIVKIENIFKHEGWLPCIVMEYIQGMTLGQRLKQEGKLSEMEAVRYIQQIGEALIVIHDKGLLHRDLKPQNIMVRDSTDEAVLIDFGIAREFILDVTQTHTSLYTPGFAPVEQYDDRAHRGEFTDVYALAATLATLVTGRVPQPSFNRVIRDNFQIPTEVSPKVQEAIKQGMIVNPEDRIQTVEAWLEILPAKPKTRNIELFQVSKLINISSYHRKLKTLLQEERWKEADNETFSLTLEAANDTYKFNYLSEVNIGNLSPEYLRSIDGLWLEYSNGNFGFSVQNRIYQSLGGTENYDKNVWEAFGKTVGWRKGESWQYYKDMILGIEAPQGHLPLKYVFRADFGTWERRGWIAALFFSHVENCRL